MVAAVIQSQLQAIKEYANGKNDSEDINEFQHAAAEPLGGGHFLLGSLQKKLLLVDLELQHSTKPAFQRFRIRLGEFMTKLLVSSGIPLPSNQHLKFSPNDTVCLFLVSKILVLIYAKRFPSLLSQDQLRK